MFTVLLSATDTMFTMCLTVSHRHYVHYVSYRQPQTLCSLCVLPSATDTMFTVLPSATDTMFTMCLTVSHRHRDQGAEPTEEEQGGVVSQQVRSLPGAQSACCVLHLHPQHAARDVHHGVLSTRVTWPWLSITSGWKEKEVCVKRLKLTYFKSGY